MSLSNTPSEGDQTVDAHLSAVALIADAIEKRLDERKESMRRNQVRTLQRAGAAVRAGKLRFLIKQPPGAGKTRAYSEVLAAVRRRALVLVPRIALRGQSKTEMEAIGMPPEKVFILDPATRKTAAQALVSIFDQAKAIDDWTIVANFQSLLRIHEADPALFAVLMETVDVIISDEAHRSVGTATKKMLLGSEKGLDPLIVEELLARLSEREEDIAKTLDSKIGEVEAMGPADARKILIDEVYRHLPRPFVLPGVQESAREAVNHRLRRTRSALKKVFGGGIENEEEDREQGDAADDSTVTAEDVIADFRAFLEASSAARVNTLVDEKQGVHPHLHIRMTATPQSSLKRVEAEYGLEAIDWVRMQDLMDDGILILPSCVSAGRATHWTEEKDITSPNALARECATNERFIMEDGRTVIEAVTSTYLEQRAKHGGYLPGVAFCETIDQAVRVVKYLEEQGLRVVRCTSANKHHDGGVSAEAAKAALELPADDPDRADVVVTVSKVGEGWDVRTLRAAIWYTLAIAVSRSLQTNGRILRSLVPGDPWPAKTSENTVIIEPEWHIKRRTFYVAGLETDREPPTPTDDEAGVKRPAESEEEIYIAAGAMEIMVAHGEIDASVALARGIPLRNVKLRVEEDDHARILIGSIHSLVKDGLGIDIQRASFSREDMHWRASGKRIAQAHVPAAKSGQEASVLLSEKLWPDEARHFIFRPADQQHVRTLIGSAKCLIKDGKPLQTLSGSEFANADRQWRISGAALGSMLFGKPYTTAQDVQLLIDRLWPIVREDSGLDYGNPDHLRLLLRSPEHLEQIDLYGDVLDCPERGWRVSGRTLIGFASMARPGHDPVETLKEFAFTQKPVNPQSQRRIQTVTDDDGLPLEIDLDTYAEAPAHDPRKQLESLHEASIERKYDILYGVVQKNGSGKDSSITVQCMAFSSKAAATGKTKDIAEQRAAHLMLDTLRRRNGTIEHYVIETEMPPDDPWNALKYRHRDDVNLARKPIEFRMIQNPTQPSVVVAECTLGTREGFCLGAMGVPMAKAWASEELLKSLSKTPFYVGDPMSSPKHIVKQQSETYLQRSQQHPREALIDFCIHHLALAPIFEVFDTWESDQQTSIFTVEATVRSEALIRSIRNPSPQQLNQFYRDVLGELIRKASA